MRAVTTSGGFAPSSGARGAGVPASFSPSSAGEDCASAGGACSMTACALVPLTPKDDTPPRRGCPVSGQGAGSVTRAMPPSTQSMSVVGFSTWRVGGSTPRCTAITILISPAAPAAAWVWPMFDLTEPSHTGRPSGRSFPYVAASAWTSMGSPSVVPVPCASTRSTCAGDSRASASAWRMTRCCAGPLGAVRPLLAPSWLMAEPRTTARTGWPLRRASESRSTRNMPMPSPQPVPSASAENALQRPLVDSPR